MNSRSFLSLVALVSCCGCGGGKPVNREPVYPVTGRIVYNGKGVDNADVTFSCKEKDRSAFGRTDSDGNFKLTTFGNNDGAVAGKHVVTIQKIEIPPPAAKEFDVSDPRYVPPPPAMNVRATPVKKLVPARYTDLKTSDLIAVVNDSGDNNMTLELKD